MNLSKTSLSLIEAYAKGYRVIDEKVYYNNREVKKYITNTGYYAFSIRPASGKPKIISVHRLVAYQKYKELLFTPKLLIRHLDNNPLNNKEENIKLGTVQENMLDKPIDVRQSCAEYASSFIKKHNHIDIINYYKNNNVSYADVMKKFNITSKGTVSFIINKSRDLVTD